MSISRPCSRSRSLIFTLLLLVTFFHFRSSSYCFPSQILPTPRQNPTIILASQKADDTTWLSARLSTWPSVRYIVDDSHATYRVPANKGKEAMVYLTYLIDHYHDPPEIMVFIHSLQYQWHNDDPNYDSATVLSRLQLNYVRKEGYVNLRCVWEYGCPAELKPNGIMNEKSLRAERVFGEAYRELFGEGEVPDEVGVSCCAQFAVTRERVLKRSKGDYERMRRWLVGTELDDEVSGRVFEYSWHVIFGKPPVHCPSAQACYCNVFGLCDLNHCTLGGCEGRYVLPEFTDVPDGWKQLDEFD